MNDDVHTPPGISAVLRELDAIHSTMVANREEVRTELRDYREMLDGKLDDIVAEARKTNGRLKKAELWIAAVKGVVAFLILVAIPLGLKVIDHYF